MKAKIPQNEHNEHAEDEHATDLDLLHLSQLPGGLLTLHGGVAAGAVGRAAGAGGGGGRGLLGFSLLDGRAVVGAGVRVGGALLARALLVLGHRGTG